MALFTIRFTEIEDNTKDHVAYIQSIYKDIIHNRIKESYEVCMGRPFLRSEAERIIGQLHEAIIESSNDYVDLYRKDPVIAGESLDVYDPSLVELTYLIKHPSI